MTRSALLPALPLSCFRPDKKIPGAVGPASSTASWGLVDPGLAAGVGSLALRLQDVSYRSCLVTVTRFASRSSRAGMQRAGSGATVRSPWRRHSGSRGTSRLATPRPAQASVIPQRHSSFPQGMIHYAFTPSLCLLDQLHPPAAAAEARPLPEPLSDSRTSWLAGRSRSRRPVEQHAIRIQLVCFNTQEERSHHYTHTLTPQTTLAARHATPRHAPLK